jgi:restriction system protein
LLGSSLAKNPRISFDSLRITATVPPLDLGALANPIAAPEWTAFAPRPPSGLGRLLGGSQRYQASYEAAKRAFATAKADHQTREAERQRRVAAARADWARAVADAKRKAEEHNAHVDWLSIGFREHDRFAVSEYVQMVLDRSPYPDRFPAERHAGYA